MRPVILSAFLTLAAATTAAAQRDSAFAWSRHLPDGARLTIRNLNGPVDIRATSGNQVAVHTAVRAEGNGRVQDADVQVREISASDVEICSVYRGVSACDDGRYSSWSNDRVSVRFTIDLPKGMHLVANTGNGDITVTRTASEVDVNTGNGDVTVKESVARVAARTGNGDVNVTGAQGPVKASTGNGEIIASVRGAIDATSGNGDVEVKLSAIPADAAGMTITTGSGDVRVTLPADFAGSIDASAPTGGITSDFDIHTSDRISPMRLRGTVGSGKGPLLKVRTGSGSLSLRKA